jgi:hypothetical protein
MSLRAAYYYVQGVMLPANYKIANPVFYVSEKSQMESYLMKATKGTESWNYIMQYWEHVQLFMTKKLRNITSATYISLQFVVTVKYALLHAVLESTEIKISDYVKDTSQTFIEIKMSLTHTLPQRLHLFYYCSHLSPQMVL